MPSPRLPGTSERMGEIISVNEMREADVEQSRQDALRIVSRLPIGSLALDATEFTIPKDGVGSMKASFIDDDNLSLGRDEGQHQTRFGQLIVNGQGYFERPILAAVKPFEHGGGDHPDLALSNEWAVNTYLNAINDRQLAYLTLGVWRNAEEINHLITMYEHDVISYDSIFWADKEGNPEALRKANIEHALVDCIRGLGYLHGVGIAHTDAEAKNLAANRQGIRFIDMESARLLPRTGSKIDDSDETLKLIRNDLEMFFDSTVQVEDNRAAVNSVLSKSKMDERLAQVYRSGLRAARAGSGLSMPKLAVQENDYFKSTIDHTLGIQQTS